MKTIALRVVDGKEFGKDILNQVLSISPDRGINAGEMRKRIKIMDAIEQAKDGTFTIEDAEYDLLKSIVENFPYQVANKNALGVIDDVLAAAETKKE